MAEIVQEQKSVSLVMLEKRLLKDSSGVKTLSSPFLIY